MSNYGSLLHQFGRHHVLFVQIVFGCLLFYFLIPKRKLEQILLEKFEKITFVLLSLTICTGLSMELIESYPNPAVTKHLYLALSLYVTFLLHWRGNLKIQNITKYVGAILLMLTSALGGNIRHGENFFWAGEFFLSELAKYHLVLVHLPLGLALFLYLFRKQISDLFSKRLVFIILSLVAASGLGLLTRFEELTDAVKLHAVLGATTSLLGITLFFARFKQREAILLATLFLPLLSGIKLEYGSNYFYDPMVITTEQFKDMQIEVNHSQEYFLKNVRPILDKKCVSCHNAEVKSGGLNLTSLSSLQGNGKIHSFYTSKDPSTSGLYLMVSERVLSPHHMPYLKGNLSPQEIGTFKSWINLGGFSGPKVSKSEQFKISAKTHWAFKKFSKPLDVKNIDSYFFKENKPEILEKPLQLRKLKLTVSGLFPSRIEIENFESDKIPFETLVDQYLASKDFGVNFASYWLDLVSYAGERATQKIEDAYLYRNFVIESLNQDKSYLSFLKEQLFYKGDFLENASYKHMLKFLPYDDDEAFYNGEIALSTVFNTTLGIEFKCARCHDHVLEPISNEKYYAHLKTMDGLLRFKEIKDHQMRKNRGSPLDNSFLDIYESAKTDLDFWKLKRVDVKDRANLSMEDFSNWITDTENGVGIFTARVYVNHVWRYVFGKALVEGEGAFGAQSKEPTNLELLNWLTHDFLEHNSSTKYLIKKLVSSQAFRSPFETCLNCSDASWSKVKRLEAEKVRDNLLLISGLLNHTIYPKELPNMLTELGLSSQDLLNVRSIFFMRKRNLEDAVSKYLNLPKGNRVALTRDTGPDFNQSYFFVGGDYLGQIVSSLRQKYVFQEFNPNLVKETYLDLLSRKPSQEELNLWSSYFKNKNFEEALNEHLHILISSNEFSYSM